MCDTHNGSLYYNSQKSITLFEAGYSSKTIAQQLAIVILLGCLLQKFPIYSKNEKNYTEIICVKHLTVNRHYLVFTYVVMLHFYLLY